MWRQYYVPLGHHQAKLKKGVLRRLRLYSISIPNKMDFRTHLNSLIFLLIILLCTTDAKFTCKSFRCKRNNEANSRRFFSQREFCGRHMSPPDNIMSRRSPPNFSFTHVNLKYPLDHSITRKQLCFLAHPNSKNLRRHIPQVMTSRLRRPRELYMAMDVKIRIVGKKNGGEKWISKFTICNKSRLVFVCFLLRFFLC